MKLNSVIRVCPVMACGVFLLVMASCGGGRVSDAQQTTQPPANIQPLVKQVDDGQEKRRAVEAQYKAMQIPDLIRNLEADSTKDVELYNSLAYREIITRGAGVGRELAAAIQNPNRQSFLTLIALRSVNKEAYETVDSKTRVAVLVDALRTSKYFNTWGLPHAYWEDSAKAIIEQGRAASEPLKSLLADKRPAPVWGSEEVAEYQKYKYRVCDYAWALLAAIDGNKLQIPSDPAQRDQLISAIDSQSPK